MGKILLSSSDKIYNDIESKIIGFKKNSEVLDGFVKICTYSKKNIETENMVVKGSDFCAGVGTYIYKSKIGKDALEKIFLDFDFNMDIRSDIVGSYCIVINKGNKLCIFIDPASTYNVYYHLSSDGKEIVLTNTYFHIALTNSECSIDEQKFIANYQHKCINGDTPFYGIQKLMGGEAIVFEHGVWSLHSIECPSIDYKKHVVDKAVEMYSNIGELFHTSGVFMTGGQDSRLALSLMLNRGMKPTLFYGVGDSEDTNTKTQDLECVKAISKRYDLPIEIMNWGNSYTEDRDSCFKKYGEMALIYSMNLNIFNEFEKNIKCDFLALGYFGEVYRNVETIEKYKQTSFKLDDFIDDLYLNGGESAFLGDEFLKYRSYIKSQFEIICKVNNMDPYNLTKQDFQTLNTVYRQRWDTVMNNFANQFCYSMPLFGDYQLTKLAEKTDYEAKEQSRFLLDIMQKMDSEIVLLPFFSHIKVKKFDSKNGILYDAKIATRLKDRIRSRIRSERLMKFARKIYYVLLRDKKGKEECELQYSEKKQLKLEWETTKKHFKILNLENIYSKGSAQGLKQILLYCKMIDLINAKR